MLLNKSTLSSYPLIKLAGIQMQALSMQQTIDLVSQRISNGVFTQHTVVNVAKLVNMQDDSFLKNAVQSCDIINIDGMGIVWGARLLGKKVPERVAGIDLFIELIRLAEEKEYSVYFLGATEDVLATMIKRITQMHPGLKIKGAHHGYFWDDEETMVAKINVSRADMLFVAISSPQKEIFINQWREKLGVCFVMGVGGSFDVLAGNVKRAPILLQKMGLEWFYRFLQEPGRMWRRYLTTNLKYIWLLGKEMIIKIESKNGIDIEDK